MIAVTGVSKSFGQHRAVDQVSLSVPAGEIYCLLGANGAGKTTLLNLLMGFLAPDAGTAAIDGVVVAHDPAAARRRTAYVPEQVLLYDHLSGIEHLRFFAALAGETIDDDTAVAALGRAGLGAGDSRRRLATYSKGMRQKVALAIALARPARAVLLDEPLSGLDPQAAVELSGTLRRLADAGLAILLTTHDLHRAHEIAARVGIMRHGRLVHEVEATRLDPDALERLYLETMRQGA